MNDTPLDAVPGWLPEHIAALKKAWITTAEQVVGISATPDGVRSLSKQLQVSEAEARRLVDAATEALPAQRRAELSQPADTSQFGLGARPPRP